MHSMTCQGAVSPWGTGEQEEAVRFRSVVELPDRAIQLGSEPGLLTLTVIRALYIHTRQLLSGTLL